MTNEYEHLNEIQKIGLDILKEIIAVCKRHDLTYYVYGGTLLGAIRHQGFIPWMMMWILQCLVKISRN